MQRYVNDVFSHFHKEVTAEKPKLAIVNKYLNQIIEIKDKLNTYNRSVVTSALEEFGNDLCSNADVAITKENYKLANLLIHVIENIHPTANQLSSLKQKISAQIAQPQNQYQFELDNSTESESGDEPIILIQTSPVFIRSILRKNLPTKNINNKTVDFKLNDIIYSPDMNGVYRNISSLLQKNNLSRNIDEAKDMIKAKILELNKAIDSIKGHADYITNCNDTQNNQQIKLKKLKLDLIVSKDPDDRAKGNITTINTQLDAKAHARWNLPYYGNKR